MKIIALAFLAASLAFCQARAQTAPNAGNGGGISIAERSPQAPAHQRLHRGGGFKGIRAVVNSTFTISLPDLAGETGCGLTILSGPKTTAPQGWKLAGNVFSGTPTAQGFYRLEINCTKPTQAKQSIFLSVSRTAPAPRAPAAATAPIPLN